MAKKADVSRWASADVEIRKVIGALLEAAQMTKPELAVRMHMPESTFYKRMHEPQSFRLDELRRLTDVAAAYQVEVPLGLGGQRV